MTSYNDLVAEMERQTARYAITQNPILKSSLRDLADTLAAYPAGLIWAAAPKGAGPDGAGQ